MKLLLVLLMGLVLGGCPEDEDFWKDGEGKTVRRERPKKDGVIPAIDEVCKTCGMLDAPCCKGSCRSSTVVLNAERCQDNLKCVPYNEAGDGVCRD